MLFCPYLELIHLVGSQIFCSLLGINTRFAKRSATRRPANTVTVGKRDFNALVVRNGNAQKSHTFNLGAVCVLISRK
jgi:hypothetical protein